MKKKIFIDFPVATGEGTEKRENDKFNAKFNPNSPNVNKWAKFCLSMGFLGMIIFGGSLAILLVQLKAPVWVSTCSILGLIGVLLFMWAAAFDVRSAKRSGND
jgi:hypothetical protein